MSIEKYQNFLEEGSQLRSISIAPDGAMKLEALQSANLALEVKVDPALRILADCQRFEATTLPIPVPLPASECLALIDPARWEEFSGIRISELTKTEDRKEQGWKGSIKEEVVIRWNGQDFQYVNVLDIDFRVEQGRSSVDFELLHAIEGKLAFEVGYLRLDPGPFGIGMFLSSHKQLQYQPGSPWCEWPVTALKGILTGWLNSAAFKYARAMVNASGQPLVPATLDTALQHMPAVSSFSRILLP
jgi:hypothetical protein